MSAPRSVFAVDRGIWADSDFAPEPFTEREAWMWLISTAAWKDGKSRGNTGGPVDLKRAEFSIAVRLLAEKWQWSKSKVDRFIQRIETRDMIRDTSRDGAQIYVINNYNHFQVVGLPKRDAIQDAARDDGGTAAGQQRDNIETGKQDNRETVEKRGAAGAAIPSTPDLFETAPVQEKPVQTAEIVPLKTKAEERLEKAVNAYNMAAGRAGWREARAPMQPSRRAALSARIKEHGEQGYCDMLLQAVQSDFLCGKNDRGWMPGGLDWFLKPANFTKVIEGAYDNKSNSSSGTGGHLDRLAQAGAIALAGGDPAHRTG